MRLFLVALLCAISFAQTERRLLDEEGVGTAMCGHDLPYAWVQQVEGGSRGMCCKRELNRNGECPGIMGFCWHEDLSNTGATCTDWEDSAPTGTEYCPRSHPYAWHNENGGSDMCCTRRLTDDGDCPGKMRNCWSPLRHTTGETCEDYANGLGCCRDQVGSRTPTMNEIHGDNAMEGVLQHWCPEDENTFWDSHGECRLQQWFWDEGYVYHADSDVMAEIEGCLFSRMSTENWQCVRNGIDDMWADFQENGLGVWGYYADTYIKRFKRLLKLRGTRRSGRKTKWNRLRSQWPWFKDFDSYSPEDFN